MNEWRILYYLLICVFPILPSDVISQSITWPAAFSVNASADPDSICQGQNSDLMAIVEGGTPPFSYLWQPAGSLSNPDIFNPVATPDTTTLYRVIVTDHNSVSVSDSVMVYVQSIPPPPAYIDGPQGVCAESNFLYSVYPVPGAITYSWTVPEGAIILSGQNTPSVLVQWGSQSGIISIIIGNNCGTSVPATLPVTVTEFPPSPSYINGKENICRLDTATYETNTIPYADIYVWNLPQGVFILSGSGTKTILVRWGEMSGTIKVAGKNSCGTGSSISKDIELDSLPGKAGEISGRDTLCLGRGNYIFSVPPVHFATSYEWVLPKGMTITHGIATNRITVETSDSAVPGNLSVYGINICGFGDTSFKQLEVKNCTSISDLVSHPLIKVFPNPANQILNVEINAFNNDYEFLISDINGHIHYPVTVIGTPEDKHIKIDVSLFPKGFYILRIIGDTWVSVNKFLVD